MTRRWFPRSLALRVTLLCGAIAFLTTGLLGTYFFVIARIAVTAHADDQLIGRTEHFRRLVGDVRTIQELHDRAMLFEALLGSASDVLILRRAGQASLVEVNPDRVPVPPAMMPVADGQAVGPQDVRDARDPGRPQMHWVAAMAHSGQDGAPVEVLAGHPLVGETQMIDATRDHVFWSTVAGMLMSTLLVYVAVRRGLRPLRRVAAQASLINPINLGLRLPERDAPLELQQMVAIFNAMLDRIATGYERLSQFSADLAHETRTPVGALIGQTQVALNRTRTPLEYQQLLESNLEELNRLRLIVDDILFLARADHAGLEIERTPLAMADELQRIADYFEGPADEAGLAFTIDASGSALANPSLCRRALHNLVVNALRYSTPHTTIRLTGTQRDAVSTISVENDGVAIPPDQLERLFDRFYRADAARGWPAESSGLGLAIVKAIMELHGGEARASCTSSGTIRFDLRFPCPPGRKDDA